jgi:hypothetical protein
MNTTVLSFYTPAMQAVGDTTSQHNQKFAERYGFAFQCLVIPDETTPDEVMWKKPELIFNLLRAGENVWWIDADALVTNPEALPYVDPAKITMSCDIHGMNAGVFHVPSTPQTLRFFYACLTHGRTLFGGTVKTFQICQIIGQCPVITAQRVHVGDKHAKLSTPVANVILSYDAVSQCFQNADNRVADDGAPQMTNVHFLGKIRAGIVDHNGLWMLAWHNQGTWV